MDDFKYKIPQYAYIESFGSLLTITYSFGNVAMRHMSFRKTLIVGQPLRAFFNTKDTSAQLCTCTHTAWGAQLADGQCGLNTKFLSTLVLFMMTKHLHMIRCPVFYSAVNGDKIAVHFSADDN